MHTHALPYSPIMGSLTQVHCLPPPPQILYNGQSVEVDGHSMRKLIADLQPNTEYSFVLMNRGSSAGGLQHLVSIRTAPDLLPHKPLPASAYIEDGRFTLSMPHVQDPLLIRCADEALGRKGMAGDVSKDGPDSCPACPGGSTSWWCPLTVWAGACWPHDGAHPRNWSWTRCRGMGRVALLTAPLHCWLWSQ